VGRFRAIARFAVPWGGYIYPGFDLNQRFEKTDALVSLAKLKAACHGGHHGRREELFRQHTQFDLRRRRPGGTRAEASRRDVPRRTRETAGGRAARAFPRLAEPGTVRVPRITADIFGARPADLNIVEGIRSISGGEGHWNGGIALVEPKLLIVGPQRRVHDAVLHGRDGV